MSSDQLIAVATDALRGLVQAALPLGTPVVVGLPSPEGEDLSGLSVHLFRIGVLPLVRAVPTFPPSLIRQLMSGRQPGRALLEVSNAWDFLEMEDETEDIRWRRPRYASAKFRKVLGWVLTVLYFVLASCALFLAYLAIAGGFGERSTAVAWIYVALGLFGGFFCLAHQENLRAAGKAANRWLGLP